MRDPSWWASPWSARATRSRTSTSSIGSKDGPVGAGVRQRPRQPAGGPHEPARGGRAEPSRQARHDHVQQGHDQGRHAGRADVRARAGRRRPRRRRLGPRGRHPEGEVEDLCIIVGVFIHWEADRRQKISDYNYQATKEESIARALGGRAVRPGRWSTAAAAARHPFAGGSRGVGRAPDNASQPGEFRLDAVRAVVTGASSGIGAADAAARARDDRAGGGEPGLARLRPVLVRTPRLPRRRGGAPRLRPVEDAAAALGSAPQRASDRQLDGLLVGSRRSSCRPWLPSG